jgi:hypothetical protein
MHWGKVIPGAVLLGIAFGFFFTPTFDSVIQTCMLENPGVSIVGGGGYAMGRLMTCDQALGHLTNGIITPLFFWFFVASAIPGAWLLFTGLQSRSLTGMKKEV